MERSLRRRGFAAVAGADEAGRGACAGPLVAAACVLPAGRRGRVPGLADSKLLTAAARERVYAEVVDRAVAWSVVVIPVEDLDARGMHVTNIEALRRAVWHARPRAGLRAHRRLPGPRARPARPGRLEGRPGRGLRRGGLGAGQGDPGPDDARAARAWPEYDFAGHKGYITDVHSAALERHGPCPEHRMRFVNVRSARDAHAARRLQVTAGGRHGR